jgi:hypothetical protein
MKNSPGNELCKILRYRPALVTTADPCKKVVRDAGETDNSPSKLSGNLGDRIRIPADACSEAYQRNAR